MSGHCVACGRHTTVRCSICWRFTCSEACQRAARCDYDDEEGRRVEPLAPASAHPSQQAPAYHVPVTKLNHDTYIDEDDDDDDDDDDDIVEEPLPAAYARWATPLPAPPRPSPPPPPRAQTYAQEQAYEQPTPRQAAAAAALARARLAHREPVSAQARPYGAGLGPGANMSASARLAYYGSSFVQSRYVPPPVYAPAPDSAFVVRAAAHRRCLAALPPDADVRAFVADVNARATALRGGAEWLLLAHVEALRTTPQYAASARLVRPNDTCFIDGQREMVLIEVAGDGSCFLHALLRAYSLNTFAPISTRKFFASEILGRAAAAAERRRAELPSVLVQETARRCANTERIERLNGRSEAEVRAYVERVRADTPASLERAIASYLQAADAASQDLCTGVFLNPSDHLCSYFQEKLGATLISLVRDVPRRAFRIDSICFGSSRIEAPDEHIKTQDVVLLVHAGQHWRTLGRYDAATGETHTRLPVSDPYVVALLADYEVRRAPATAEEKAAAVAASAPARLERPGVRVRFERERERTHEDDGDDNESKVARTEATRTETTCAEAPLDCYVDEDAYTRPIAWSDDENAGAACADGEDGTCAGDAMDGACDSYNEWGEPVGENGAVAEEGAVAEDEEEERGASGWNDEDDPYNGTGAGAEAEDNADGEAEAEADGDIKDEADAEAYATAAAEAEAEAEAGAAYDAMLAQEA